MSQEKWNERLPPAGIVAGLFKKVWFTALKKMSTNFFGSGVVTKVCVSSCRDAGDEPLFARVRVMRTVSPFWYVELFVHTENVSVG